MQSNEESCKASFPIKAELIGLWCSHIEESEKVNDVKSGAPVRHPHLIPLKDGGSLIPGSGQKPAPKFNSEWAQAVAVGAAAALDIKSLRF